MYMVSAQVSDGKNASRIWLGSTSVTEGEAAACPVGMHASVLSNADVRGTPEDANGTQSALGRPISQLHVS